jgi:hypothetical protein
MNGWTLLLFRPNSEADLDSFLPYADLKRHGLRPTIFASMNIQRSTPALCAFFLATAMHAQTEPLFAGAEPLDSCVVELPLTYAKKDKERYTQAARYLEDVELIHMTYDKKTKAASYTRVFVVVMTAKDGTEYVYVESAKDHLSMGGAKTATFPKFAPNTERYYNATCFDAQLAAHPELEALVKEVGGRPE